MTKRTNDPNRPGYLIARATKSPIRKASAEKRKSQRRARRARRIQDKT